MIAIIAINSAHPHAWALCNEDDDVAAEMAAAHDHYALHEPAALPIEACTMVRLMQWEADLMARRATLEACTHDQFIEAIGALPPLNHTCQDGMERFLLGEPVHHDWYLQYARVGDRYARKLVDRGRPSTWITAGDVIAINEEVCHETQPR